jgi:hypothetical protein
MTDAAETARHQRIRGKAAAQTPRETYFSTNVTVSATLAREVR